MNSIVMSFRQDEHSLKISLCEGMGSESDVHITFQEKDTVAHWYLKTTEDIEIAKYFRRSFSYSQVCNAEYRQIDKSESRYFLPVSECPPLWDFDFATDFIALLTDIGFKYCGGLDISIYQITGSSSVNRLPTYFGVRISRFFCSTLPNTNGDEYLKSRFNTAFGGVLDVITSRLNTLLHNKEWVDVIRIAMTLYDISGRYNFACANASNTIANIAYNVEQDFNKYKVEAFTTRLLRYRMDTPVRIWKGDDNIYHIENCGNVVSFNWNEKKNIVKIRGGTPQALFPDETLSASQQNGLALNFRLVNELAIEMFYLPLWANMGGNFLPAYAIVLVDKTKELPYEKQSILLQRLRDLFYPVLMIENNLLMMKIKIDQTRAAIGSIMSRNGSHNIGSHVLAALSHNVGTMPDDRVLYQYIQHRMDYIATATTDFPIWSQPLPLVGNVIKNFLIQRHLLDHITGSEGLHAYQFQNDKVPTSAKENSDSKTVCQPETIRIHARRIKDDMNWNELTHFKVEEKDFIDFIPYPTGDYEDESCKESLLSNDVEVAIPGGVVGRHAFYTIVENVLRNAAKHELSKLEDENRKSACLDVFVDFKDNPSKGIVEIVIWTDSEYSMQHYAMEQFKNPNGLDRARIEKRLATETGSGALNLDGLEEHQRLQVKMARSFIAEDGQLRKENWGLAEMRISAGYLNVADIADIGGISTSDLRFELIKPVMIQNGEHYCLGYHFDIPKPKELLIVVPESAGVDEKTMRDAHAMLMQYGVGVMSENDVFEESCKKENSAKLSYAYILLKDFKKKDGAISDVVDKDDMRTWKLPFRVVTESKTELNPEGNKPVDRRADYVFSDNKNVFDSTSRKLYAVATSKEDAKSFATAVLSDVYRSWVQHLKREHYNKNPDAEITLAIDVNREVANDKVGKKGGKDLVSDADLLKVLFEICFDKAVDSFIQIWETKGNKPCQDKGNGDKYCQGENIDVRLKVTLKQMKKMCPREVAIEPSRVIKVESDTDGGAKENTIVFTTRQLLRQQLIKWCALIYADKDKQNDVSESVRVVWRDLCDVNKKQKKNSDIVGLDAFLDYLECSVLPQTKVFLSMYEESFVTLPKSITVAKEVSEDTTIAALDNQEIKAAITEDNKKELLKCGERLIAYWRHENFETVRECRYLEPLSGAQSYLAAFECLKGECLERTRFVTKLIENGLVRILIIDERAKKFSDEHSEVKKVFDHIGIAVLDDKCPQVEAIFSGKGNLDDVVGGEKVCDYDVLVIHQGIIDKKLKDHGNADAIRKFIEGLKRKIRYVVVTTGRGSPANIPPEVRVLPFSVIESTLFRKYPEKMILVDAIMNTLPLARKERA